GIPRERSKYGKGAVPGDRGDFSVGGHVNLSGETAGDPRRRDRGGGRREGSREHLGTRTPGEGRVGPVFLCRRAGGRGQLRDSIRRTLDSRYARESRGALSSNAFDRVHDREIRRIRDHEVHSSAAVIVAVRGGRVVFGLGSTVGYRRRADLGCGAARLLSLDHVSDDFCAEPEEPWTVN